MSLEGITAAAALPSGNSSDDNWPDDELLTMVHRLLKSGVHPEAVIRCHSSSGSTNCKNRNSSIHRISNNLKKNISKSLYVTKKLKIPFFLNFKCTNVASLKMLILDTKLFQLPGMSCPSVDLIDAHDSAARSSSANADIIDHASSISLPWLLCLINNKSSGSKSKLKVGEGGEDDEEEEEFNCGSIDRWQMIHDKKDRLLLGCNIGTTYD